MQTVSFTITNSGPDSDWQLAAPVSGGLTRSPSLLTDANCPSASLSLSVRDPSAQVTKAVQNWTITVGPNEAFGLSDMASLSSLVDGLEWRFTLGSTPGSTTVITLRVA